MTITKLVLENQKMKLDAQREAEHHDRMVGELEKVYKERDEAREALADWDNAALHVEADHQNEKHCGCVPVLRKLLTDALKDRDEWAAMCGRYKQERDIAENKRIDMAQQLESEKQCHDRCQNERDALVQKLDAWEEIAEHLHHLVQHPAYGVDQAIQRMDVLEAYKHLKNGH